MNQLIYPLKYMNISQTYNGKTSHKPHATGSPKDYPIDDTAQDRGQSYFYCPCDEVKITRIYTSGVNTLWIQSTTKVDFADGKTDYMTMQVTHMNDAQMKKLKVGQTFRRKQQMFLEGKDGATANHFHMSVGRGTMKGKGWTQNSSGKWVLTTTNGACKPENAFFIDSSFTTIISSAGLSFKRIGESDSDMTRGYFKVGDENEGVYAYKQLLLVLKKAGTITQTIDDNNKFTEEIKTATKQVQKAAKITQDGYAGPITIRACYTLLEKKINT